MIEIVCGPMMAGKTEYLLSKISKYSAVGRDVLVFKPKIDTRSHNALFSRSSGSVSADEVDTWGEIYSLYQSKPASSKSLIVVDETQFLPSLVEDGFKLDVEVQTPIKRSIAKSLRDFHDKYRGLDIIVSGLLFTTEQEPFLTMQSILTVSDKVTHLTGFCVWCGEEAAFTICNVKKDADVMIGDKDIYETRCGRCIRHNNPNW